VTFVGLWVYTVVDSCVCVFQWGSRAAAFSGAEVFLPSVSSELSIRESCCRTARLTLMRVETCDSGLQVAVMWT
jgi:hypothetical protein